MSVPLPNEVEIRVDTAYIEEQSAPDQDRYVFAYTITISNHSTLALKLLRRRWLITDANNQIQEVQGDGVIGQQPHLQPGQSFTYTSGAVLETPLGCMQGCYYMITDAGIEFEAPIPVFRLRSRVTMH